MFGGSQCTVPMKVMCKKDRQQLRCTVPCKAAIEKEEVKKSRKKKNTEKATDTKRHARLVRLLASSAAAKCPLSTPVMVQECFPPSQKRLCEKCFYTLHMTAMGAKDKRISA
uniref:Uncharacterized protein n=1 Tax=Photinus pyralis TaxID=7054 RepID=A0A1Y1LLQ2_PHOPY